jgi:hypothetical protein
MTLGSDQTELEVPFGTPLNGSMYNDLLLFAILVVRVQTFIIQTYCGMDYLCTMLADGFSCLIYRNASSLHTKFYTKLASLKPHVGYRSLDKLTIYTLGNKVSSGVLHQHI